MHKAIKVKYVKERYRNSYFENTKYDKGHTSHVDEVGMFCIIGLILLDC